MDHATRHIQLSQWIGRQLSHGIPLSEDIKTYMAATFGEQDLARILESETDGEVDSLMELLFFPDHHTQRRFEADWGDTPFDDHDADCVIQKVTGTAISIPVVEPESGKILLSLKPTKDVIAAYVNRLNIAWRPPLELLEALTAYENDRIRLDLRISLRNRRRVWPAHQIDLMVRLISSGMPAEPDLVPLFAYFIKLLPEWDAQTDPYLFLSAKKFFFFQSLCKAEAFEQKRQTSNMETMMLQGNRAVHGSIEEWRQNMRRIDRISQALFGRTEFFQNPSGQCVDLSGNTTQEMLQGVMRTLS